MGDNRPGVTLATGSPRELLKRPTELAVLGGALGRDSNPTFSSVDSRTGIRARSDQFVTLGESVSAVRVSPENRKVVRLVAPSQCSGLVALVLVASGN